ncbi:ketosynthase chain-length factor [Spongiactinospora gelatinilytica]|uniref:Ketosynthase chain-length factor n=1 Tax=Spongiactinospora gelatinilytica TaxID=2666298 RepID=A0A2W2GZ62_9ACTN|nr:ketosynthase chain-length factor [Spongiactinospora gelatinilytica]PZG53352.1 ketosynthase chain-length factor [Spongiactinospora gelatinilytica]
MTQTTIAGGAARTRPATAVITGLGVVAPNGMGAEEYWTATLRGESGIAPLGDRMAKYPARLAGQVASFVAEEHIPSKLMPQTDRVTRLALAAAEWALADAGLRPAELPEYSMGVVTSNASGGFEFTHREIQKLWTQGPQTVSVYESFAWFYAVNTGQISIRHGMRGPSGVLVAEQAGGLDAVGHARRAVRRGTPHIVTGGVESSFDPWGWVSHIASGRLSGRTDPARAYLPFDGAADGYVPGEGGAILILEDAGAAARRGAAKVYGEVAGYAATFDPRPGSGRPPGLEYAIRKALDDAGARPETIDVVFADAAGVPRLDREEAAAITAVFGPGGVPVSAPKALTGRLYAGSGPLDVACALLCIRDGLIPAVPNIGDLPADYRIDLVRGDAPRPAKVRNALVLARGKGGFNAAVVLRKEAQ